MTKRASGELEKGERRADILTLADKLCRERPYESIRMADLAADLGLAKGTLYLYFPSKESLFLALLSERLDAALTKVFASLDKRRPHADVDGIAREIGAALAADLALPRLLSIVHSVLEKKVPYEEAVAFKRKLALILESAGVELSRFMPALAQETATRFFLFLYANIVGLVQLTDISSFMEKVGGEPGLEVFKLHFEDCLRDSARFLLLGLLDPNREFAIP